MAKRKPQVVMKTCRECGIAKPAHEFGKNKARKDGLAIRCKDCMYDIEVRRKYERLGTGGNFGAGFNKD